MKMPSRKHTEIRRVAILSDSGDIFGSFACGMLLGSILSLFIFAEQVRGNVLTEGTPMQYADVVTIVLTCVTVVITCVSIVLAILGVFGFQQLKQNAVEAAIRHVEKELSTGGNLRSLLENRVDAMVASYAKQEVKSDDWGDENDEYGEAAS
ncbi:hypothetical protein [Rhizobium sp. BK602]|uniref:hypothetical protein n=1 Tax=Rhizobium sp. BK602 TaxID=2586986 RepID=UPI00161D64C9|nr:hypothetical protein [Rhizobium sp. BK602]MBB3607615.1 hypothetical protein [Rhizobium sp. BK602]